MTAKLFKYALKALNLAITVVLALLVAAECCILFGKLVLKKSHPTVFGYGGAVVLTGSMSDAVNPNDFIITRKCESYAVGDIVTYKTDLTPVTHRIIEKTDNGFITKGDANNTADGEILPDMILGKVVAVVPKVGAVIGFLQTPLGMLCLVFAAILPLAVRSLLKK